MKQKEEEKFRKKITSLHNIDPKKCCKEVSEERSKP